jgi:hypothetical protein
MRRRKSRTPAIWNLGDVPGLQPAGKWVSWISCNIFDSQGALDGILGRGDVYGTKAHCFEKDSDLEPEGWEWTEHPFKTVGTRYDTAKGPYYVPKLLCGTRLPTCEDVNEYYHDQDSIGGHAPHGYCKHCVQALKKRQQKSR